MPINRAKVVGVLTAIVVAVAGEWALGLALCREIGGSIHGFGLLCQAPGCDAQSVFSILAPGSAAVTGLLLLLFLGLPIGLLAYSTVDRWSKPLPPK